MPVPTDTSGRPQIPGALAVGDLVHIPWLQPDGPYEVTQLYGAVDNDREPAGHGAQHWHAGIDIGCPTGTQLVFPHFPADPEGLLQGTAHYLDDPTGYGSDALWLQVAGQDIVFGHLGARLVADGATVRPGTVLAVTDNEGNSSGPHLHFEVRTAGRDNQLGAPGSDVDPRALLFAVSTSGSVSPGSSCPSPLSDPAGYAACVIQQAGAPIGQSISEAEKQIQRTLLGGGQVVLGTGMVLGGLLVAARGVAPGPTTAALARLRPAPQRRPQPARRPVPRGTSPAPAATGPDRMRLRKG